MCDNAAIKRCPAQYWKKKKKKKKIRPTLLYICETWPMSVKNEKRMATTEMRTVRWAMVVSLLEHRRNEEILEEAKVEPIATVMKRRRLEWFGHVKK